ncbi:hypothetical protein RFI_34289 [Reticulomyxa filosa]|uniref:Uncharacterized protein n=1 Tax=Reticulomyxa filosa TaxID=46433 RepID=X6LP10_RETFI|nr:hypothetical protein RFI_34289 [Reticulomyxa filosa]|eukprot:ETO03121.1 hypothetical protein RFI_34289 [Reticulomyxa filosa]
MWNHQIDLNLIYVAIAYLKNINQIELLLEFEQWKFQNNNEKIFKNKKNEFLERRCRNHNVNLFFMFFSEKDKGRTAFEHAALSTVNNGLPFVKKDKNINKTLLNL